MLRLFRTHSVAALFKLQDVTAHLPGGFCDVVRPASPASDRYMVLVAGHAEERGGVVFLVEVEFKAVVPLDDPDARTVATRRLRAISDWLEDTDCPLHGYCSDTLKIHGFSTGGVTDEDGARSYAEILTVTFGAMAP